MATYQPFFVLAALAAAPLFAMAQADPTRPPRAWLATQPGGTPVEAEETGTPEPQIVVSGRNRGFVMIRGRAVHPGETYNGAKLVAIGPEGAVWEREGKRETQTMSPAARKSLPGQEKASRPSKSTQKQQTGGVP